MEIKLTIPDFCDIFGFEPDRRCAVYSAHKDGEEYKLAVFCPRKAELILGACETQTITANEVIVWVGRYNPDNRTLYWDDPRYNCGGFAYMDDWHPSMLRGASVVSANPNLRRYCFDWGWELHADSDNDHYDLPSEW